MLHNNYRWEWQLGIRLPFPSFLTWDLRPPLHIGMVRSTSSGEPSFSRHAVPALPCGNIGLAQDLAGSRGTLWEGWQMAGAVRLTVLGVARGWRQFEGPWTRSLGSRSLALAAAPSSSASPWRLLGALCLQRPPLVSKLLTPLQEEMEALLQQVGLRCGSSLLGAVGEVVEARWLAFDPDSSTD